MKLMDDSLYVGTAMLRINRHVTTLLVFLLPCFLRFLAVQAVLDVVIEYAEIVEISDEYFDDDESEVVLNEGDDGRNTISTKIIITKNLPEGLMGHVYIMGYSMGEYKIDMGIDIRQDTCEMLNDPVIMGPILSVMGFSEEICPPEIGTYEKEDYFPVMDFMPESFPDGKYQLILELLSDEGIILKINVNCLIS